MLITALCRVSIVRANYGRFSLSICNSLAEGSLSTQCDSSRETSSILRSRWSNVTMLPITTVRAVVVVCRVFTASLELFTRLTTLSQCPLCRLLVRRRVCLIPQDSSVFIGP